MKTWHAGTLVAAGILGFLFAGFGLVVSAFWGELFFRSFPTPEQGATLVQLNFYLALALIASIISTICGGAWLIFSQPEFRQTHKGNEQDSIKLLKGRYAVPSN